LNAVLCRLGRSSTNMSSHTFPMVASSSSLTHSISIVALLPQTISTGATRVALATGRRGSLLVHNGTPGPHAWMTPSSACYPSTPSSGKGGRGRGEVVADGDRVDQKHSLPNHPFAPQTGTHPPTTCWAVHHAVRCLEHPLHPLETPLVRRAPNRTDRTDCFWHRLPFYLGGSNNTPEIISLSFVLPRVPPPRSNLLSGLRIRSASGAFVKKREPRCKLSLSVTTLARLID
jgi:hypothetical protein